jgi:hypothetical protein
VFTVIDGQIAEIYRDFNPKALKFARFESETDIVAIGEDASIYRIAIEGSSSLKTSAAFSAGCALSAVLNAPALAFITESGALAVLLKCSGRLNRIFDAMKEKVIGIGGLKIEDYRRVGKNGKFFPLGPFVDGNFLQVFESLQESEKEGISELALI